MKYQLKLIGVSLANQARILKRLEKARNLKPDILKGVHYTRVHVIRSEARSNHIALGFLRGRDMDEMELPLRPIHMGHVATKNMTRTAPNWTRIEELILEHGSKYYENEQALRQAFAEFRDTGSVGNV